MVVVRYLTARAKSVTVKEVPLLSTLVRHFLKCSNLLLEPVLRRIRPLRRFVRVDVRRKLICFALISSILVLPGPGLAASDVRALASTAVDLTTAPICYLQPILKSLFGFGASPRPQREDTLEDRRAQVARIRITPPRLVSYIGQVMTFGAVGSNFAGEIIEGADFFWESSDPSSVQIDDTGRATFLRPGLTTITCRAGAASTTARVLVRPGARPRQTDAEWKTDQDSFADAEPGSVGELLPSLLDKLVPTAHAQGGGYAGADFGYDELWIEPRNLAGLPRNRAIEQASLGPVLPEGSNFNLAMPLIGLGGRGMGAGLTLNYNSRVWSRHGNAVTFSGIGGWPFAGFSLGFGRILAYGATASTRYVLVDPDGTLHYLGTGNAGVNTTYRTSDGTNITFVSQTAWGTTTIGGSLYYNDGTKVTIQLYNNRLLPVEVKDSNGNYVQIAYKHAVMYNDLEIVNLLLAHGAFVDARNRYGQTALNEALSHGFHEIVRLLLKHNADANARYGPGISPLHLAAYKGDTDAVEALLSKGADPNAADAEGNTPLFDAIRNGKSRMVGALLQGGASASVKNKRGQTPLVVAKERGDEAIIKLLRINGIK
jgi:ankyrin repeat protein